MNGKIYEKGTLTANEHDKEENILGSVWLSLFMCSNGNAYNCPRRLATGRKLAVAVSSSSSSSISKFINVKLAVAVAQQLQ
jgi:hypothetical protein